MDDPYEKTSTYDITDAIYTTMNFCGKKCRVIFLFDVNNDFKLNEIAIMLPKQNPIFYDTEIKKEWKKCRDTIVSKYNAPTKSIGYPHFFKNKQGHLTDSDIWILSDQKNIYLNFMY